MIKRENLKPQNYHENNCWNLHHDLYLNKKPWRNTTNFSWKSIYSLVEIKSIKSHFLILKEFISDTIGKWKSQKRNICLHHFAKIADINAVRIFCFVNKINHIVIYTKSQVILFETGYEIRSMASHKIQINLFQFSNVYFLDWSEKILDLLKNEFIQLY